MQRGNDDDYDYGDDNDKSNKQKIEDARHDNVDVAEDDLEVHDVEDQDVKSEGQDHDIKHDAHQHVTRTALCKIHTKYSVHQKRGKKCTNLTSETAVHYVPRAASCANL